MKSWQKQTCAHTLTRTFDFPIPPHERRPILLRGCRLVRIVCWQHRLPRFWPRDVRRVHYFVLPHIHFRWWIWRSHARSQLFRWGSCTQLPKRTHWFSTRFESKTRRAAWRQTPWCHPHWGILNDTFNLTEFFLIFTDLQFS